MAVVLSATCRGVRRKMSRNFVCVAAMISRVRVRRGDDRQSSRILDLRLLPRMYITGFCPQNDQLLGVKYFITPRREHFSQDRCSQLFKFSIKQNQVLVDKCFRNRMRHYVFGHDVILVNLASGTFPSESSKLHDRISLQPTPFGTFLCPQSCAFLLSCSGFFSSQSYSEGRRPLQWSRSISRGFDERGMAIK